MGHLHQKITWTEELKKEKNSYVGVSFEVGADKRISNIKIDKPAGNGFDAIAKAAFESFDGVVTAPTGKHNFMLNYFSDKGPVDKSVLSSTAYDVKLVIVAPKPGEVKVKFPPPVVKADKKVNAVNAGDDDVTYIFYVNGKRHIFTDAEQALLNKGVGVSYKAETTIIYKKGIAKNIAKWGAEAKKTILWS